jgi:branched-chain amino acid transport system permease protein
MSDAIGVGGAMQLVAVQTLNGIQLGIMLFLIAAGLTLVLGLMDLLNLTHGAFYMLGAYAGASLYSTTQSFAIAFAGAVVGIAVVAASLNLVVMRHLYNRDHLTQVLATFGLLLFINEMTPIIWGPSALHMPKPTWLEFSLNVVPGIPYPVYRLAVTLVGLCIAFGLYYINGHTRLGMLIRAGASNREMLSALGVRVGRLYAVVFCAGAALAAVAGLMTAPISSVDSGMGDAVLILSFVVVTIGGLGSVRGAFIAALLVGLVDTYGRSFLPYVFGFTLGPALSSMSVYLLMAIVLVFRPKGLLSH